MMTNLDNCLDGLFNKMDKLFNKDHELYELYQEYRDDKTTDERFKEIHAVLVKSQEGKR